MVIINIISFLNINSRINCKFSLIWLVPGSVSLGSTIARGQRPSVDSMKYFTNNYNMHENIIYGLY